MIRHESPRRLRLLRNRRSITTENVAGAPRCYPCRATRGEVSSSRQAVGAVAVRAPVGMAVRLVHAVALEPVVEIPPAHPENIGGALLVSPCIGKRSGDKL